MKSYVYEIIYYDFIHITKHAIIYDFIGYQVPDGAGADSATTAARRRRARWRAGANSTVYTLAQPDGDSEPSTGSAQSARFQS